MTGLNKEPAINARLMMINTEDNDLAAFESESFHHAWEWITAPPDWNPENTANDQTQDTADALLFFARIHEEERALELCRQIRETKALDEIPLILVISVFQMPLGNNVAKLPNAAFIFSPLKEAELIKEYRNLTQKNKDTPYDRES